MSVKAKYKTKVKNIIKLEAFYNKINKSENSVTLQLSIHYV